MPNTGDVLRKLKSKWVLGGVLVVVIVVGFLQFSKNGNGVYEEIYTVGKQDVRQSVLLSGTVEAVEQVDLSFGFSGKVALVYVEQGQQVEKGALLAELDIGTLEADLLKAEGDVQSSLANIAVAEASVRKAEANLALVRAQNRGDDSNFVSTEENLLNTIEEQNILVQNAKQELLDNDLQVYPKVVLGTLPAPVVSGSYKGEAQGEYEFKIYTSSFSNIGRSLDYSGLERGTVHFKGYDIPEPLGGNGLFISFPSEGAGLYYNNSIWSLPVPNIRSATYQSKLSAYNKAQSNATLAIANAESDLEELQAEEKEGDISLANAEEEQAFAAVEEARGSLAQAQSSLVQARATLARVEAQIEDGIIVAPFSGTIARVDFVLGETVGTTDLGITLITEGEYELSMNVPEIDIAKIAVGDFAQVTLDVYDNIEWEGEVNSIELVETEVEGVPVYETDIGVLNPDNRIRVGMNARAAIEIAAAENVLAVPASYLERNGGTAVVYIKISPETIEERVVETGLRGSNNFFEITSGLSEGEVLIKPDSR